MGQQSWRIRRTALRVEAELSQDNGSSYEITTAGPKMGQGPDQLESSLDVDTGEARHIAWSPDILMTQRRRERSHRYLTQTDVVLE